MKITIKTGAGAEDYTVTCSPDNTVAELKGIIQVSTTVPATQQRLIFKGHVLKDAQTIESVGAYPSAPPSPLPALTSAPYAPAP